MPYFANSSVRPGGKFSQSAGQGPATCTCGLNNAASISPFSMAGSGGTCGVSPPPLMSTLGILQGGSLGGLPPASNSTPSPPKRCVLPAARSWWRGAALAASCAAGLSGEEGRLARRRSFFLRLCAARACLSAASNSSAEEPPGSGAAARCRPAASPVSVAGAASVASATAWTVRRGAFARQAALTAAARRAAPSAGMANLSQA
mmetsp:Transcript_58117/g.115214  ORF Transcript_58117/g.115214 Transcript_58117/m.115214 type:complete len:204 (-) Transcript_58117:38-649(-)